MQVSKTTKILIVVLISILLITGVILITKNIKKDTPAEQPITDDNEPTADIKPKDNQTASSNQPIIDPEPETTSNDQPINQEITELDTTDWRTYTNEEYGFSFKYPGEWEIKLTPSEENARKYLSFDLKLKNRDEFAGVMLFGFYDNKDNLTVKGWAKRYIDTKSKAEFEEEVLNTRPTIVTLSLHADNPFSDLVFTPGDLFACSRQRICDIIYGQDPGAIETYYPQLDTRTKQLEFIVDNIFPTLNFF